VAVSTPTSIRISAASLLPLWYPMLVVVVSILSSCASGQGIAPPGGPPDSTAPSILGTTPPNGATNVREGIVTIEFSEFVQESNVQRSVIITPIPRSQPEFDWSGRELSIEFTEPLMEDRTYAITFGADITDLAGNRLGTPLTLRFSTGAVIDSGRISGSITGGEGRRVFVFAYRMDDTSGGGFQPDSVRPDFIAPVADNGRFSLEALPNGRYRLVAVADEAGDQLYSPGVDAYGLALQDVEITSQAVPVAGVPIRLRPAPLDIVAPTLFSASSLFRTRTQLRFNEPIDTSRLRPENFSITTADGAATIRSVWRSPGNWIALELEHSPLPEGVEATARAQNLVDTSGIALPDSASSVTFSVTDEVDSIPPALAFPPLDSLRPYSYPDSIQIVFTEGVELSSTEGLISIVDTTGSRIPLRITRRTPTTLTATPRDTVRISGRATMQMNLGNVSDLSGNRVDPLVRLPVTLAPSRQPGTMRGTISDAASPTASHVVMIRHRTTGATFRKTGVQSGPWEFTAIPEGEYDVSAFRDDDRDGEYDYGSLAPYQPAEEFLVWRSQVQVRPRWVTDKVDLVFGATR
jgi:hypothetical protein